MNGKKFAKRLVQQFTHTSAAYGGDCTHHIYGIGGGLYEETLASDGTLTHTRLPHRTTQRKRTTGTVDWYINSTIRCARHTNQDGAPSVWTKDFYIPLTPTSKDVTTKLNRG